MTEAEKIKQISPGKSWLALSEGERRVYLNGLIEGLNQGLRHCAGDVSFALTTRLPDGLSPAARLAVDTIIQQMRTWAKTGIKVFKYSRAVEDYAQDLCCFYERYPKFCDLAPGYLMIYMDDQHGMSPDELFNLHENSLHGFRR